MMPSTTQDGSQHTQRPLVRDSSFDSVETSTSFDSTFTSLRATPDADSGTEAHSPALSDSLSFDFDFDELADTEPDATAVAAPNNTPKDDKDEAIPGMAGQPVFNDALAQIVADYGFGHVGFEDAGGITLFGHNSPMPQQQKSGSAMEMAFSPANLVVNQAILDHSKLPTVPEAPDNTASVAASELLRVLTSSALAQAQTAPTSPAVAVASPADLERVPTVSAEPEPAPQPEPAAQTPAPRKRKRATDTTDLLPLDAPIQSRKYRGASKTSRKPLPSAAQPDADEDDELDGGDEAASSSSKPKTAAEAMLAKRLNNTLAARRSRHRKAEELKQLHDQIADLTAQADAWKQKFAALEAENAALRAQLRR